MQKSFLIVILEAPIPSIWCKLCFQAVIALRNATMHFWWQSQYLLLQTHKGSKTKSEFISSFSYVLVTLKSTTILLIWIFLRSNQHFSKISSEFLPFGPSSSGHQGRHGPSGSNFNALINPLDAITLIAVRVSDPLLADCCLLSIYPTFVLILKETVGEQEVGQTTLFRSISHLWSIY